MMISAVSSALEESRLRLTKMKPFQQLASWIAHLSSPIAKLPLNVQAASQLQGLCQSTDRPRQQLLQ